MADVEVVDVEMADVEVVDVVMADVERLMWRCMADVEMVVVQVVEGVAFSCILTAAGSR